MNKAIRNVIAWHKKQFPDATIDDIIKKLQEEIHELLVAIKENDLDHIKEELADVCIVSISLKRHMDIEIKPRMVCHHYFSLGECIHEIGVQSVERKRLNYAVQDFFKASEYYARSYGFSLVEAISDKMEVNKKRDWSCR